MEPIHDAEIVLFTTGKESVTEEEEQDAGFWCSQSKRKPLGGIPFPVGSLHF